MVMNEFRINDYISLRLVRGKTMIYINGEPFRQCIRLVLQIPKDNTEMYDEIDSIDEAAKVYDKYLINNKIIGGNLRDRIRANNYTITPDEEFKGHCSNLQVWYEHNYDTRLLHSNLSFPLLKRLTEVGDPLAKRVFKEEIAKRFESGYKPVINYLIKRGYLDHFTREEAKIVFENSDLKVIHTKYGYMDKVDIGIIEELESILKQNVVIEKNISFLTKGIFSKFAPSFTLDGLEIYSINLEGIELKEVPTPIKNLLNLHRLNLRDCGISELSEWIGEIKTLNALDLAYNHLTTIPDSISNLKSLNLLDLQFNKLIELPTSLLELENLKWVKLDGNPEEFYKDMRNLKIVHHFREKAKNLGYFDRLFGLHNIFRGLRPPQAPRAPLINKRPFVHKKGGVHGTPQEFSRMKEVEVKLKKIMKDNNNDQLMVDRKYLSEIIKSKYVILDYKYYNQPKVIDGLEYYLKKLGIQIEYKGALVIIKNIRKLDLEHMFL